MNYKEYLTELISNLGIDKNLIEISIPPKEGMGDYCLPCFKVKVNDLKDPHEKAQYILNKLNIDNEVISNAFVIGPYLNFNINKQTLSKSILERIESLKEKYGSIAYSLYLCYNLTRW